jgi:hypothetical protein
MAHTYDMVVISLKKAGYIEEMLEILRDVARIDKAPVSDQTKLADCQAISRRAKSLLERWEGVSSNETQKRPAKKRGSL